MDATFMVGDRVTHTTRFDGVKKVWRGEVIKHVPAQRLYAEVVVVRWDNGDINTMHAAQVFPEA